MRNLFDQYSQPENRLTHALAVCLHEDRKLLRAFLQWIAVRAPVGAHALEIGEQTLPGDLPESDEVAERKGLPDIVIHDGTSWCLLVESKVQAPLTDDQLRRHRRTLSCRGFNEVRCLALTKQEVAVAEAAIIRRWSEVYE